MKNIFFKHSLIAATLILISSQTLVFESSACSRVVYKGNDSLIIVGRSLDWKNPIPTNLYVYPRGIKKQSNLGENVIKWESKYGAVYAVGYDGGITEGMNEKGLVINGLFCKGTVYGNANTANRPPMSLAVFVGWLLDMNATTKEVIDVVNRHDFNISGATFDGGTVSALHWGVTDASGHTAIIEFDNGEINIYEGDDLLILTNDPPYPKMSAINDYWRSVGGTHMLPGTVRSSDRFARADFFVRHVKKTNNPDLGFSIARSILMNVSVPYTYTIDTEPNVSSTQWRSFADLHNLRYYFDIVDNYGVFYVDLNKCNLSKGASIIKLDTSESNDYIGDITHELKPSKSFKPMY